MERFQTNSIDSGYDAVISTFFHQVLKMKTQNNSQAGFSYIDVLIAIVIMLVGILALLSALTANLVRSYESEQRVVAKQLAVSTIESIISAKELKRDGIADSWQTIRNVTGAPIDDGIFLTGLNPVREELGADGVAGTADDACPAPGACPSAFGPSNTSRVLPNYYREITITDVVDPERPTQNPVARRRIDVTISFSVNAAIRTERSSTILTNYEVLQ